MNNLTLSPRACITLLPVVTLFFPFIDILLKLLKDVSRLSESVLPLVDNNCLNFKIISSTSSVGKVTSVEKGEKLICSKLCSLGVVHKWRHPLRGRGDLPKGDVIQ